MELCYVFVKAKFYLRLRKTSRLIGSDGLFAIDIHCKPVLRAVGSFCQGVPHPFAIELHCKPVSYKCRVSLAWHTASVCHWYTVSDHTGTLMSIFRSHTAILHKHDSKTVALQNFHPCDPWQCKTRGRHHNHDTSSSDDCRHFFHRHMISHQS